MELSKCRSMSAKVEALKFEDLQWTDTGPANMEVAMIKIFRCNDFDVDIASREGDGQIIFWNSSYWIRSFVPGKCRKKFAQGREWSPCERGTWRDDGKKSTVTEQTSTDEEQCEKGYERTEILSKGARDEQDEVETDNNVPVQTEDEPGLWKKMMRPCAVIYWRLKLIFRSVPGKITWTSKEKTKPITSMSFSQTLDTGHLQTSCMP